ncbi:MAG: diguanylate cyclase [Terracidiphilus sp.]|nr:diguanylate cyclase [Terracidiphilus sp.]
MERAEGGGQESKRPRVLIAEDDAVVRLLLRHWLAAWGFDVTEAADGNEAWAVLEQEDPPKLIVMDWVMPGLDGIELCKRVRARSTDYYQYILMVTGRSEMGHVEHALESGADDCIGKPFEQSELRARISVANRILALQDELIGAREALRVQAMKDGLTGLWNRTAFQELFEVELERASRMGTHVGLLLLDIDHFKAINDTYGHMTGDVVLRQMAKELRNSVRAYDFEGRFGGEEFLIAVPGCEAQQLREHAERIRAAVEAMRVSVGDAEIRLTASVGATVSSRENATFDAILAVADGAMYRAKYAGRNRAVFCDVKNDVNENPQLRCATCTAAHNDTCLVVRPVI